MQEGRRNREERAAHLLPRAPFHLINCVQSLQEVVKSVMHAPACVRA